ncbi:MAG: hypothetical protein EXX96DRAFT_573637 [Benjaminiella poitrasii]|nr:MAG: hypothetical protein EXX96DRAFT_573637 [Benjaminiella poitrasii]
MNNRHPSLPSISTLLAETPLPPPKIIINRSLSPPPLQMDLSPLLSPIDSYASSSSPATSGLQSPLSPLSSPLLSFPALQGDDPPAPVKYNNHLSPLPRSPSFSSSTKKRKRSSDAAATDDDLERPPLPPMTQIVLSESGLPILKRRRGRPPSIADGSNWTFLTPTVWNVKPASNTEIQKQREPTGNSSLILTSSNMETTVVPRKKRGRKPKQQMVGNSCFAWKDVVAAKRTT